MTTNTDRMKNRPLKGAFIRHVLGTELSDTLRIYPGMQVDVDTLEIMIERGLKDAYLDFSHVLTVKHCLKDESCTRFKDIPNFRIKDEHGSNYFLVTPTQEIPWSEYDNNVRSIYRVIAPIMLRNCLSQNQIAVPSNLKVLMHETLNIIAPVFWFDYNFVSRRFTMRFPNGIVVRRMKPSQYAIFPKAPKLKIEFGGHTEYALVFSQYHDTVPQYWLDANDMAFLDELASEMRKHLHGAGWMTDVKVTATKQMLHGVIDEYETK